MPSSTSRKLTAPVDFSDYTVERDKADHGAFAMLEDYDMFPYDAPVRQTMSNWSGGISVITYVIMLWTFILGAINITGRQFTYSTSVDATRDANNVPLPTFAIVVRNSTRSPWYDSSYYQWKARYISIFESDSNPSKPRQVQSIPLESCSVVFSTGRAPTAALCPVGNSGEVITVGKFEDDVYKYVDLALVPCEEPATVPTQDRKCADRGLVETMLLQTEVGIELWTNSFITPFDQTWVQAMYLNTGLQFQGIEAFFQRHVATRQNIFRAVDYLNDYMQFAHYLLRVKPLELNEDGTLAAIFKIYMRTTNVRTEDSIVQYGFVDFVEQVGGMWSIVSLILGGVAVALNKRRYDRNLLDTSKFTTKASSSHEGGKHTPATATASPPQKGLADAIEDWRKEAGATASATGGGVVDMEMKQKKHRRFSTLPLQREDKQEETDIESDEALRRSMMLNSVGANAKGSSNSDQFITVFKIKELQTMFSAGQSAPSLSVPLMRAALSKMMRSFRMLPLTEFEMAEALHIYARVPSTHFLQNKIDAWRGTDKTLRFPSYHELVLRLNDIVRRRFTTRGKVHMMVDGLYCGIDTAALSSVDRSKVSCFLQEAPEKQDIFIENVGRYWCIRDQSGYYLTYPRDNDVATDIQFSSSTRGECQRLLFHFDHADPQSGCMLMSTGSGSPRYIVRGASHLQVQAKSNISENESENSRKKGPIEDEYTTFQLYLYYHDQPLSRNDLEAICHVTQIHVS